MGRNKSDLKVIKGGRLDRVVSKRKDVVSKPRKVLKKGRGNDGRNGVVKNTKGNFFVYAVIILALIGVASWVTEGTSTSKAKLSLTDRVERIMVDEYGMGKDVRVVSAPVTGKTTDLAMTGTWYVSSEGKMYVYMRDDATHKHALYEMGDEVKHK